jgi:flagellar assembly protein FliH
MSKPLSFAELADALTSQNQTMEVGGFRPIEWMDKVEGNGFTALAGVGETPVPATPDVLPRHFVPSADGARTRMTLPQPNDEDPIRQAWKDGFDNGVATERRLATERNGSEAEALAQLRSGIARINQDSLRALEARMRDAVLALCRQVIDDHVEAPERLAARVRAAASLLAGSGQRMSVEANEADRPLLSEALGDDWEVVANPRLARGALRVLSGDGGVEDGPEQWKRALEEAIRRC